MRFYEELARIPTSGFFERSHRLERSHGQERVAKVLWIGVFSCCAYEWARWFAMLSSLLVYSPFI